MALTSPPTSRMQSVIELLRNTVSSVACVCVVLSAPAYAADSDPAQDGETVPRSNDTMNPVARQDRELYINRLIDALGHDDAFKVRLQAAVLLGRSNDERAASALISALAGDQHYTVRAAAATALANLNEEKGIAHIVKAIGVDKEQFVREEAERALTKFDRAQAMPAVIAAYIGADDPRVRKVALAYVAPTPTPEVEPILIRALGDAPENYALAKTAVLQLPADRKLALLQRGIDDREASVRRGSVNVLREVSSAEAARMVLAVYERDIEVEEVRSAARDSLRAMRAMLPIPQFVKDAQSSSERYARARAIKLLGVVGGDEAEKVLLQAAKDDEIYIRGSAVLAMQYLGSQSVVPALEKLAGDPDNARILLQIRSVLKHLRDDHTVTASAGVPK